MDTLAGAPYPSDVSDEEWAFHAPYLTLMREDAPQRRRPLRELFNGPRFIARMVADLRMLTRLGGMLPRQRSATVGTFRFVPIALPEQKFYATASGGLSAIWTRA